jgi:hypothetical protein
MPLNFIYKLQSQACETFLVKRTLIGRLSLSRVLKSSRFKFEGGGEGKGKRKRKKSASPKSDIKILPSDTFDTLYAPLQFCRHLEWGDKKIKLYSIKRELELRIPYKFRFFNY